MIDTTIVRNLFSLQTNVTFHVEVVDSSSILYTVILLLSMIL